MIEVYSRMAMVKVIPSESTGAVVGFLRDVILAWRRFPQLLRTDQGSAFSSQLFRRALTDLEITHDLLPPGTPDRKPFVERFLRTLNEGLLPNLPSFVGANVGVRQRIRERKKGLKRSGLLTPGQKIELPLSVKEFQRICDDWVHLYNHTHVHSSLGMTPVQKVEEWCREGQLVRGFSLDDMPHYGRLLGALLAPAAKTQGKPPGVRVVRKGVVRVDGVQYAAPELAADWCGREVVCCYDESDLSRIWVYGPDRTFICMARGCGVPGGIARKEAAAVARQAQETYLKQQMRELKREVRQIRPAGAAKVLSERRARSSEKPPEVATRESSPIEWQEAQRAAEALLEAEAGPDLDRELSRDVREAMEREETRSVPPMVRPRFFSDADERYRWCLAAREASAEFLLTKADREFVESYEAPFI
jgi:hypothetical protein